MGGRIHVLSLLLAGLAGLHVGHSREDWQPVWSAFLALRSTDHAAAVERAEELSEGLRDPLRRRLLEAVSGVSGATAVVGASLSELEPSDAWPLSALETWLAAQVLPAGETRSRAVAWALEHDSRTLEPELATFSHEVGVEAAEDLRLAEAITVQRALHARFAAEWSASNLAATLTRAGAYREADAVLAAQEERLSSSALRAQRGILSIASGDAARGRQLLGTGLSLGSVDAAQVLARLDLAEGRFVEARRAFGALLATSEPGPWALYGWGLSLVDAPLAPAAASPSAPDAR